jgi:nitrate reductase NapE component
MSKRKKEVLDKEVKSEVKSLKDFSYNAKTEKNVREVKKAKKKKFLSKKAFSILIFVLFFVLVVSCVGILAEYGIFKNVKNPLAKPVLFVIEDKCSLIVGQLISTIRDEETCELKCKSECNVREMTYVREEFILIEDDCNVCNCFCK